MTTPPTPHVRIRWGRVGGLVWWLAVLLFMMHPVSEWPRSLVMWLSVLPISLLLIGGQDEGR